MRSIALGPPVPRRRTPVRLLSLAASLLALAACAVAGSPHAGAIPSAVVQYGPSLPANLDQYAAPGNVIVVTAEQRNRNPARIRAWRARGAIVLAYVNLVDWHAPDDPIVQSLYGGNFPSGWFYPGNLSNYPGYRLTNLEDTCPVATYNGFTGTWGQYAARWIRNEVIKDGSLFNGVFLDVWGDQLYSVNVGGPGSHWDSGVAKWGQEIRAQVGPNIFLVGNNTQSHATAAALNGRMWESFESRRSGYNDLTGQGTHPGIVSVFPWPEWRKPRLDILWRNEANPSQDTKNMLNAAAQRVTQTGTDVAVGASDHGGGFPAPFGAGGGSSAPGSGVPAAPPAPPTPPRTTTPTRVTTTTAPKVTAPKAVPAGAVGTVGVIGGAVVGNVSTITVIAGAGPPITGKRLVMSSFARGEVAPWGRVKSRSAATIVSTGTAKAGKVAFGTAPKAGAFATLSALMPAHKLTTTVVRVRAPQIQMPAGRARALVVLSSSDGFSRQVGVVRVASGELRWATWTRTASGGWVGLKVSEKALPLQTWVTLRVTTNWSTPAATDAVRIGREVVLRAPAGRLSDREVQRVSVGLGRASSQYEAAAVQVKSIAVIAR